MGTCGTAQLSVLLRTTHCAGIHSASASYKWRVRVQVRPRCGTQGLDRNSRSEDATCCAERIIGVPDTRLVDRVAGQSPPPSLTARVNSQRPRQLHDASPHVSLLHTWIRPVGLGRQLGGRLRTRISCQCPNNSDAQVDYSPFLLACQSVRLATTPGPEGPRLQEGDSTWAVGTPFLERE